MQTVTIEYQIATYSCEVELMCNENDDYNTIIARAKKLLSRKTGQLSLGYERFEVIERRDN